MAQLIKSQGDFVYMRGQPSASGGLRKATFGEAREIPAPSAPPMTIVQGAAPATPLRKPVLDPNSRVSMFTGEDFGEIFSADFAGTGANSLKKKRQDNTNTHADSDANLPPLPDRETVLAEYKALREEYVTEGEQLKAEAETRARGIIEKAQREISAMYDANRIEASQIRLEAEEHGFEKGYTAGTEQGYHEGFDKGFAEGKQRSEHALTELMRMTGEIAEVKEEFFLKHEARLFDLIFTIANKVTEDSLKQKDKNVIQKLLKAGAKAFRNAEFIKVTLSKLDVEQSGEVDYDMIKSVFREGQQIEIEVLKDKARGTVILDDGAEKIDLSVATQLEMIEKLGKGKFRNTPNA